VHEMVDERQLTFQIEIRQVFNLAQVYAMVGKVSLVRLKQFFGLTRNGLMVLLGAADF
jgi:hypothetical protein